MVGLAVFDRKLSHAGIRGGKIKTAHRRALRLIPIYFIKTNLMRNWIEIIIKQGPFERYRLCLISAPVIFTCGHNCGNTLPEGTRNCHDHTNVFDLNEFFGINL